MYGLLPDEVDAKLDLIEASSMPMQLVYLELERATEKFGPFYSAMEGQAIIAEEFDEFTKAVRHEGVNRAREEAVQLAAMAIRFLIDVPEDSQQKNNK